MTPLPLPRIACFHGGGSSASIYAVQCSALQHQLSTRFSFEFLDAPFERSAGPGVLPFFTYDKFGPYKTWFRADDDGVERVWSLLRERDAAHSEHEVGDWVGVMGFSQGTRVVGGLLLDLQRRKERGLFRAGEIDFKFGVLCMGSGAPMLSDLAAGANDDDSLIRTPTLHLHGLRDACYEAGKMQCRVFYEQSVATVCEIDYHHAMPWHRADVLRLAQGIRELWEGCL